MTNPILLKANVNKEQALETIDFLYGEYIDFVSETPDNKILWISNGVTVAKWTNEYRNIMISEDFVNMVSEAREYFINKYNKI